MQPPWRGLPLRSTGLQARASLVRLEKRHIERILDSEGGEVDQTASRLGIHRGTLYRKMKKYGIAAP